MIENKTEKNFDSVSFFRVVKEKMDKMVEGMSLEEMRKMMLEIREGKIKVV